MVCARHVQDYATNLNMFSDTCSKSTDILRNVQQSDFWGRKKKAVICNICQLSQCKYSQHAQLQATNRNVGFGKRHVQLILVGQNKHAPASLVVPLKECFDYNLASHVV